uniref:Protein AF-9 homolog n=1 Tax=Rhabditophanes sp. KR3021 TaxID=114890 RepID=A0AC35TJW1_9BILA
MDPNNPQNRLKGVTLVKGIVMGNTAYKLREKDGDRTHEWKVYLRPYLDEDIGRYITKVQFKLHDSYKNSNIQIEKPPFEVTETGWGEFDVNVKIFFADINEKPIQTFHYIRLHAPLHNEGTENEFCGVEHYEELVFQDPTSVMADILNSIPPAIHNPTSFFTHFGDVHNQQISTIRNARQLIQKEIEDLKKNIIDGHEFLQSKISELKNVNIKKELLEG